MKNITCLNYLSGTSYAGTTNGLYYLTAPDGSWAPVSGGLAKKNHVQCLSDLAGYSYAGTANGLYYLTGPGGEWSQVNGLGNKSINVLFYLDGYSYAGTSSGLYYLTGAGGEWKPVEHSILASANISSYKVLADIPYVGTSIGLFNYKEESGWHTVATGA